MTTKRRFEIRKTDKGYDVKAITSGDFGSAGGNASVTPFATEAEAKAWVTEQFSVPESAWEREADGTLAASL